MAYQSLEDRIVKNQFAAATASKTPPGLPVELPGHEPEFVALTRGAERAGAEEIALNPRSASVRLRALEKVGGYSMKPMKAKRSAPARGNDERRRDARNGRRSGDAPQRRKPTREQRPLRSGPQTNPIPRPTDAPGTAEERQPGQGARQGA